MIGAPERRKAKQIGRMHLEAISAGILSNYIHYYQRYESMRTSETILYTNKSRTAAIPFTLRADFRHLQTP